jgi:hypothetical protein
MRLFVVLVQSFSCVRLSSSLLFVTMVETQRQKVLVILVLFIGLKAIFILYYLLRKRPCCLIHWRHGQVSDQGT